MFKTLLVAGVVGIGGAAGLGLAPPVHAEPAFCADHEPPGTPHEPGNTYITACRGDDGNGGCDEDSDACEPIFDFGGAFPGVE